MIDSNNLDTVGLFVRNMHYLKKTMFGTDEVMSKNLNMSKSTLNDKLNGRSQFNILEINQIGTVVGIHPGFLLIFDLSEWKDDLPAIGEMLELMEIPDIHLQFISRLADVKRLYKEDIENYKKLKVTINEQIEGTKSNHQKAG